MTKIEIFQNCDQKRDFQTILTKIKIFEKFLTKIEISKKIPTKIEIPKNFDPNRDFVIILIKIVFIFQKSRFCKNIDQNIDFPKFLPKWRREFRPKSRFCNILTKIEVFRKFSPESRFLTILAKIEILTKIKILRKIGQYRDFSKIWLKSLFSEFFLPKSRFFEKFYQNGDFSKIFTKVEIFENFDQNRDFQKIVTKIEIFQKFWPKSRFSKNFHQNWGLRAFWPKSTVSKIFTEIEILTNITNFDEYRNFPNIITKIEIFRKFSPKSGFSILLTKFEIWEKFWTIFRFFENID